MKKQSIKEQKENALFTPALIPSGNDKLKDFDNMETGERFRYAQVNTLARECCPWATEGCKAVCYATKGRHNCSNVKDSRTRSFEETKRADFAESLLYTMNVYKQTKRYAENIMLFRIHESGDFYNMEYLLKWTKIWRETEGDMNTRYVFYTKSFPLFLKLNDDDRALLNRMMEGGQLSMNLSVDDTTSPAQWKKYVAMRKAYPLANTYTCTEDPDSVEHDNICDCADCAKCGGCNTAKGKTNVVKIHSASKKDMEKYRAGKRA